MNRKINKRKQGELFEKYGVEFLVSQGYKLLTTNYYTRYGEIDIIVEKKDLIVFVEVKQRTTDIFGTGEYSIGYQKQRRMYFSAKRYISEKKYYNKNIRFDALIFNGTGRTPCNWIKNIIWGDEIGF